MARSDLFPVSLAELVACAGREVQQRARVYPRLVAKRRMSAELAEREQYLQGQILALLRRLAQERRRLAVVVVPAGYASAEAFAEDCGFELVDRYDP